MIWNLGEHWYSPKRVLVAVLIAAGIYGVAVAVGSILYATDTIATGATHNDCPNYREEIAEERNIDEEDVPDEEVKNATIACLETHELEPEEAFREEYLIWGFWPGIVTALVFLFWPLWTRILLNQEAAEDHEGGGGDRQVGHA